MPTNMTKLKWLEYPCLWICNIDVQIIDWIYNGSKLVYKSEPNEHRNTTGKQTTSYQDDEQTTPDSDGEIEEKHKAKKWI